MIWIMTTVMAAMAIFVMFVEWWLLFVVLGMGGLFAGALHIGAARREANAEPRLIIDRNGIQFGASAGGRVPWGEIVRTRFFAGLIDGQPGLRFAVEVRDRERVRAAFDIYDQVISTIKGVHEISLAIAELDGEPEDIRAIIAH